MRFFRLSVTFASLFLGLLLFFSCSGEEIERVEEAPLTLQFLAPLGESRVVDSIGADVRARCETGIRALRVSFNVEGREFYSEQLTARMWIDSGDIPAGGQCVEPVGEDTFKGFRLSLGKNFFDEMEDSCAVQIIAECTLASGRLIKERQLVQYVPSPSYVLEVEHSVTDREYSELKSEVFAVFVSRSPIEWLRVEVWQKLQLLAYAQLRSGYNAPQASPRTIVRDFRMHWWGHRYPYYYRIVPRFRLESLQRDAPLTLRVAAKDAKGHTSSRKFLIPFP